MRINDFYNILEIVKQNALRSKREYLKLPKVVRNNQRYDFRIAYTGTPDERHGIQYELNLEDKTWTLIIRNRKVPNIRQIFRHV